GQRQYCWICRQSSVCARRGRAGTGDHLIYLPSKAAASTTRLLPSVAWSTQAGGIWTASLRTCVREAMSKAGTSMLTAPAMRIDFRLRPLREIAPWHNAAGSNPHLTWFGLTDGWYWISVDGAELFRYSQTVLDTRAHEKRGEPWLIRMGGLPYVDYQVAQLWGDLLDGVPDVLAPIPPRLARALG